MLRGSTDVKTVAIWNRLAFRNSNKTFRFPITLKRRRVHYDNRSSSHGSDPGLIALYKESIQRFRIEPHEWIQPQIEISSPKSPKGE
ncbi:hypothetical protein NPIL_582611 [Nephila pilipes]|uniref:Uncharacterized protein n=1 Tax=Nephila pilipes TaxID=299642 RepID=A0A8X6N0A6_NEPPI|nr:hypothetical protein NPIL_582611 [Nephila pilipes]